MMGASLGLVLSTLLAGSPAATDAQERVVRFGGRVQWIAGQQMIVQLDQGGSVSVDLVRVPQDHYAGLVRSERVVVTGVVTDSYRGVIGTAVTRGIDAQAP